MNKPTPSPEQTLDYRCPTCGNTHHFTGVDVNGYGGPDACAHDHEGPCAESCSCVTELRQDFDVDQHGDEPHYHEFEGGEPDSEIGSYTSILCRQCGATLWSEVQEA